jgi:hypothetical protein
MNPNRDILFLALSSHGSSDPLLSVSNGSLGLQQLTGEDLSADLRHQAAHHCHFRMPRRRLHPATEEPRYHRYHGGGGGQDIFRLLGRS